MDIVFKRTYLQCVIEHVQTLVLVTEEMVVTLLILAAERAS